MKQYPHTLTAGEIREFVKTVSPLILEIGCHEGTDTLAFLESMPQATIFCFDCESRAIARWYNNLQKRRQLSSSVFLVPKAVADVDGSRMFHASTGRAGYREDWDFSGSLSQPTGHYQRSPEIKFKDPIDVPCIRLDTWYDTRYGDTSNTVIDFVWADVQGSQLFVIEGAQETFKKVRYLYIESHSTPLYADEPTQEELIKKLAPWFCPIGIYARENILFEQRS